MELCTSARRLTYRGAVSKDNCYAESAILAGLGMASNFMFLKLVGPLGQLQEKFDRANIYVIADDIRLGFQGVREEAIRIGCRREVVIQILDEGGGMQVEKEHQATGKRRVERRRTFPPCIRARSIIAVL